ncbi:MAG: DUF4185 domain-containing protein [Pyrinomonadaceae bacterium]
MPETPQTNRRSIIGDPSRRNLIVRISLALFVSYFWIGPVLTASAQSDSNLSRFFATAQVDTYSGYDTKSRGDLFPSCWADDGFLYTANGDGWGFGDKTDDADIVLSRVDGTPETGITGLVVSRREAIANIWGGKNYNRKPTGMVAVDGDGNGKDELYLAVQDLNSRPCPDCFNDAPNASISRSDDYGKTWIKSEKAMFADHKFTTIFFLDFGKSGENASVLGKDAARYVYAYGIDYNWRSPTDNTKPKPADLYLARVPKNKIQDRAAWEFFSGMKNGRPAWSSDIEERAAVLHDARRIYPELSCGGRPVKAEATEVGVISQGGVVYNKPLNRYIYSSWTWYTFEFYEAPAPWGPWRLFLSKDFGAAPLYGEDASCDGLNEGGYPTTIPSKFISDDGRTMWVQSNSWERWNYACGTSNYNFSLRKLTVEPFRNSKATNKKDPSFNIAVKGQGVTPIEKTAVHGRVEFYNDGLKDKFETSRDCDKQKTVDHWGFIFSRNYNFNRVVYTPGETTKVGGWFDRSTPLKVQVRQKFQWKDASRMQITPAYPFDHNAQNSSYQISFKDISGDGIRIIGSPGGVQNYTSIAELEVYFK